MTHATLLLADTLGAIVAGHRQPEVAAMAARHAAPAATPGAVPLLGCALYAAPPMAAFLTGLAGTAVELDEGNYPAGGHPAIHALAAALAAAPADAPATALRDAFAAGYNAGSRVGAATRLRPAAHPHGTWGTIGAAAAVAHLRGLDAAATQRVLDIAASLGLATSATASLRGGSVRNVYAGAAAQNGLLAADLAEAGITGEPGGIAAVFGKVIGEAFDAAAYEASAGRDFTADSFLKLHACCRETQGALEAIEALLQEVPLGDPAAIAGIEVATFASAALLSETRVATPIAGRFSIPFVVATRLIQGHAWIEAFEPAAIADPATQALAARVTVREDPALSALLPARRVCRLRVRMRDGTQRTAEVTGTPGDPDRPLPGSALRDKFRRMVEPSLGARWEPAWHLARHPAEAPTARALILAFRA